MIEWRAGGRWSSQVGKGKASNQRIPKVDAVGDVYITSSWLRQPARWKLMLVNKVIK
jgi:hypothetical protein